MLKSFKVLKDENEPSIEGIDYTILINTDHITSLKAINIPFADNIIAGYWVRLVTGKTYKATSIPQFLIDLLENQDDLVGPSLNKESENTEQEAFH